MHFCVLLSSRPVCPLLSTSCMQVGMRHFNIRKNKYFCPIINLDKLWGLVGHEVGPKLSAAVHVCSDLQGGSDCQRRMRCR